MIRYRSDYNLEQMRERIRTLVAAAWKDCSARARRPGAGRRHARAVLPGACHDADGDCAVNAPVVRARLPIVLCLIAIVALLVLPATWLWRSGVRSLTDLIARRRNRRAPRGEPGNTNSTKEIEPS